jgi:hypothetical protein
MSIITNTSVIPAQVLIDTGAISASYLSSRLMSKVVTDGLDSSYLHSCSNNCRQVCDYSGSHCQQVISSIDIKLKFLNEVSLQYEILAITVNVLDNLPSNCDIIVGFPDVCEHSLLAKHHKHFSKNPIQSVAVIRPNDDIPTTPRPGSLVRKEDLLDGEAVDDLFDLRTSNDDFSWGDLRSADSTVQSFEGLGIPRCNIQGSAPFQDHCIALCLEFQDIFSTSVREEPADVPPMDIQADSARWLSSTKNIGPARMQSVAKQTETRNQIKQMLALGVIQKSKQRHCSQILLTPKPDNKWRFCVDFRLLNEFSECSGWPIPNVKLLLERVASQQARHFAVLDLTSGYHQTAINPAHRYLTAFITFMGVYEWCRVPMGLKGAPAYFQQVMATVVLAELLYIICELYIDDILVYGNTEEALLQRLREVFNRLREHRVTVSPKNAV